MIVRGVDYPERVIKEFIGEQALTIDNLIYTLAQKDSLISALKSKLYWDSTIPDFKQWLTGTHQTSTLITPIS